MDKYKTKTSFNKWFSSIKLKLLSKEAKQHIAGFNRYVKKFHFETALKLFLHGINTEKESLRHLDTSMVSPDLQQELGLDSISHTQLSRTLTKLTPAVLWEIFLQLVGQAEKLEGRTNPHKLFIVDSTTFSLNKQRYPWAKFRKTKAGVKLHLKVCFMEKNQVTRLNSRSHLRRNTITVTWTAWSTTGKLPMSLIVATTTIDGWTR